MEGIPLINGIEYDFADVAFAIAGVPVTGITAISYKETKAKTNHNGAGRNVISRSYGRKTFDANISLYMDEVRALQKLVPTKNLVDIPPFNITVSYIPADTNKIHTDIIYNAEFTENSRNPKNDTEGVGAIELPLIISHIGWDK